MYSRLLEQLPKRESEAASEIERANEVIQYLPYWAPKMMYVLLPDLQF